MRLFLPCLAFLLASAPLAAQVVLDPAFGSGNGRRTVSFDLDAAATDGARRIFPTTGGGFLVVGQASNGSGIALALTRLTSAGQIDVAFGTNGKRTYAVGIGAVVDAAQDSQGRIVIAGTEAVTGGSDVFVARLLPNGEIDPAFGFLGLARINVLAQDEVFALASGPQDEVLALVRSRENAGLGWAGYVAALDASGQNQRATVLAGTPEAGSGALAWSSGRNALLVGLSSSGSQTCNFGVYFVTLAGSGAGLELDSGFLGGVALSNTTNGCTQARITTVAAVPGSGAALLAGHREDPAAPGSGQQRGLLLRIAAGGGLDPTFNGGSVRLEPVPFPATDLLFQALAVDAQGGVLVAANLRNSGGPTSRFALFRYLPTGVPDAAFNGGSASTSFSFTGSGFVDSPLAVVADLRLAGSRIMMAGRIRWSGASDDDFAVAALTEPGVAVFADGFEP